MPRHQILSPTQRRQLLVLPEESDERLLARYYTLSTSDLEVIRSHRENENRLGFALMLCILRYPGRKWRPREEVPAFIVEYVAEQLGVHPSVLQDYARPRVETRRDHLIELRRRFGFHNFTPTMRSRMAEFLLPVALSTDKPVALVTAFLNELRQRQVILPAVSTIESFCWRIRQQARQTVYTALTAELTQTQREQVRQTLALHPDTGLTTLAWLNQPPGTPSTDEFQAIMDRLEYILRLGINPAVKERVHANRLREMYQEARRLGAWRLDRSTDEAMVLSMLVAFMLENTGILIDQGLEMHHKLVQQLMNRSEDQQGRQFQRDGRAINAKVREYISIGRAIIAAQASGGDVYQAIESVIPWAQFVESISEAESLVRPENFDAMDLLVSRYPWMRQYYPQLWQHFEFEGREDTRGIRQAARILRDLDSRGESEVPSSAPTDFVPERWQPYVMQPNGEINRAYYEMCASTVLSQGLRSGAIWVHNSRQYRNLDDYLLPRSEWAEIRQSGAIPVAVNTDFETYICERGELLDERLHSVGERLVHGEIPDARFENDRLHLSRSTETVPRRMQALSDRTFDYLPLVKITDLLVEVDKTTHFSDAFVHQQTGEVVEDKVSLYAALLADALNLGPVKMAEATPSTTLSRILHTMDWYMRPDTYSRGLSELVNFHHGLPFARYWGDGTTSSSDAQFFPTGGTRSALTHYSPHYRQPGIMIITSLSDQYSPYFTNVISTSARQAPFVVDALMYHETDTDLDIYRHSTDTHGFTDYVFGVLHLLGYMLAPRIRNFHRNRLYTLERPRNYPELRPLIGGRIRRSLMEEQWDEALRLTSSIRLGTVTASLMLGRLGSYARENPLAGALREIGRIERTLFSLDWIEFPELRRQVNRSLLKGEARNTLQRALMMYRQGIIRDRSLESQQYRASGLNLVVAAILVWNTVYLPHAIEAMRLNGEEVPEEHFRHISPLGWEHIGLTGDYLWNLEPATDLENLRPLRRPRA